MAALTGTLLRPLADEDIDGLATACAAVDPYRRLGFSAAGLAGYLRRDDPALARFALVTGDTVAGVLALRRPWLRGPFIEMLAVLPKAQGHGLGRRAIEWAAAQAVSSGGNLWATVSDFNWPARAFYRRLGFAEIAELPGLVAPTAGEILLRRTDQAAPS